MTNEVRKPRPLKIMIFFNEASEPPALQSAPAQGEAASPETGLPPATAEASQVAGIGLETPPVQPQPPAPPAKSEVELWAEALRSMGCEVSCVDLDDDIDRVSHAVIVVRPDLLINMVEQMWGDPLQSIGLCHLYELYGYPYVGSDALALATCQERARTRLMLQDANIPVPGFKVVRDINAIPDTNSLTPPLIVTQAFDDTYEIEGKTAAINTREELEARIQELALEYDMPLLVEEYVEGRHIQAIVLGNLALEVQPLTERIAEEEGSGEVTVVAQLDVDTAGRARQLAKRAFQAMACRDMAQVDFCLDDSGTLHVIDVRALLETDVGTPFRVAAEATPHGFEGVVERLVQIALKRSKPAPEPPQAEAPKPAESAVEAPPRAAEAPQQTTEV